MNISLNPLGSSSPLVTLSGIAEPVREPLRNPVDESASSSTSVSTTAVNSPATEIFQLLVGVVKDLIAVIVRGDQTPSTAVAAQSEVAAPATPGTAVPAAEQTAIQNQRVGTQEPSILAQVLDRLLDLLNALFMRLTPTQAQPSKSAEASEGFFGGLGKAVGGVIGKIFG